MTGAAGETAPAEAEVVRGWYSGLLGLTTPVLVLGCLYSAIADRLVFCGWGLLVAAVTTVVLRQGLSWGWARHLLGAALAFLLAAAFAGFALLESAHHEILDLGLRAVFPRLYHPAASDPRSAAILAGGLALAGLLGLASELRTASRPT